MNDAEALAWLYGTQNFGIKLGLDRVRDFLAALGWEGSGQRFLHVAGTNGKGSVCAMLDSVCRAAGLRTGLFTSPHLVSFRERILIDGERVSKEALAVELSAIRIVCEREETHPTFFEITAALALQLFRKHGVEVAVLETGMGGRLDATNVVRPKAAVITSIGLDHMQFLGETLEEIAWEKAGIIKPGTPLVTGPLPLEAREVVAKAAAERGAEWVEVTDQWRESPIGLKGAHQRVNATVAARALEAARLGVTKRHLAEGLERVKWPGRFQDTGEGFVLDGAHNPDAARRLVETWREEFGERKTAVILGMVRDKDPRGICSELAAVTENFMIVPVRSPRGGGTGELQEVAASFRPSRTYGSLQEAIAAAPHGEVPVLITGSLFLIGEALVCLGMADQEREVSAQ